VDAGITADTSTFIIRETAFRRRRLASPNDMNRDVIEKFRANGGKVGGRWSDRTLLLLHHIGARTGIERVNPLVYLLLSDGSMAVFGSKGGAPTNPDWYHNLVAHPEVSVEVGTDTLSVVARVAQGEERDRIWDEQKRAAPNFAEYEAKTTRVIPVIVLERTEG
jgi:deazaflavin-dependent oxidoreductase (nitroreductase family)